MKNVEQLEEGEYRLIEKISVAMLDDLYRKTLNISTASLFKENLVLEYREHIESGIRYFHPMITGGNEFYTHLQKIEWYYQCDKEEYKYAAKHTSGKNILEIGCGSGEFYKHSCASKYEGLECNPNAIRKCREKSLAVCDMAIEEYCILNANKYDVVCLFQVLEHVKNPLGFLNSAQQCLNDNGLLIVSVPSVDGFVGLAKNNILNMPPHHVTHWPDKGFDYIATCLNLKIYDIYHHKLDSIHFNWYASIFGREIICRCLGLPLNGLITNGFFNKIITKLGSLLGLLIKKGIENEKLLPNGHTVTVVYQKIV